MACRRQRAVPILNLVSTCEHMQRGLINVQIASLLPGGSGVPVVAGRRGAGKRQGVRRRLLARCSIRAANHNALIARLAAWAEHAARLADAGWRRGVRLPNCAQLGRNLQHRLGQRSLSASPDLSSRALGPRPSAARSCPALLNSRWRRRNRAHGCPMRGYRIDTDDLSSHRSSRSMSSLSKIYMNASVRVSIAISCPQYLPSKRPR